MLSGTIEGARFREGSESKKRKKEASSKSQGAMRVTSKIIHSQTVSKFIGSERQYQGKIGHDLMGKRKFLKFEI